MIVIIYFSLEYATDNTGRQQGQYRWAETVQLQNKERATNIPF